MNCTDPNYESHPGKFESSGAIGEKLHEMSMYGCDDAYGDVCEAPMFWMGLLLNTNLECAPHALLYEDSDGFVTYESFDTVELARAEFDRVVHDVDAAMELSERLEQDLSSLTDDGVETCAS
jgi:hypothetical protein